MTGTPGGRVKITARISPTLQQRVQSIAEAESQPVSNMVAILLREACERRDHRRGEPVQAVLVDEIAPDTQERLARIQRGVE